MTDDRSIQMPAAVTAAPQDIAAPRIAMACSSMRLSGRPAISPARMPSGYDAADIRVLDWIVAHRRQPRALKALAKLAA